MHYSDIYTIHPQVYNKDNKTTRRKNKMKKIIITSEMVNIIAEEEIIRQHEKKAKAAITKNRVKELISEGIDPEVARVMAKVGL